jgi:hypothetical protein
MTDWGSALVVMSPVYALMGIHLMRLVNAVRLNRTFRIQAATRLVNS